MNIEQIAKEAWAEVCKSSSVGQSIAEPFLRRCLSKLAEQAGEPVAYAWDSESAGLTYENHYSDTTPLFTQAQLIAAQQRTAEACAKVIRGEGIGFADDDEELNRIAAMLEAGEWRKYL